MVKLPSTGIQKRAISSPHRLYLADAQTDTNRQLSAGEARERKLPAKKCNKQLRTRALSISQHQMHNNKRCKDIAVDMNNDTPRTSITMHCKSRTHCNAVNYLNMKIPTRA